MILQFAKEIKGKPTYFVEKILNSFLGKLIDDNPVLIPKISEIYNHQFTGFTLKPAKKHTIRFLTPKMVEKWKKQDRVIHFMQWTGKPYHDANFQFAPEIKVQAVQKLEIREMLMAETDYCHVHKDKIYKVKVGFFDLHKVQIKQLAINDGFDTVDDFFEYFTQERIEKAKKEGKEPYIIHWTELEY